jgi:hypothetical protein
VTNGDYIFGVRCREGANCIHSGLTMLAMYLLSNGEFGSWRADTGQRAKLHQVRTGLLMLQTHKRLPPYPNPAANFDRSSEAMDTERFLRSARF